MDYLQLIEFCGEDAAKSLSHRIEIQKQIHGLQAEQSALEEELKKSFSVDLSLTDVLVASIAGIVCGTMNGLLKSSVPQHGKFKHKHTTTRTGVDYKVPKPKGMKGSVQGIHRQIGPGHDLGRFSEALDLMAGRKKDFPLWGETITKKMGGSLHPGNVKVEDFLAGGTFKIPDDPKAELMNHLLIDFFTKTSLPLPFTSYIADHSEKMAKIMMGMYGDGLNLKNLVGNVSSIAMLQLITHSYVYLFKSATAVDLYGRLHTVKDINALGELFANLNVENKRYLKSNEFNVLQAIAHGSSFLVDTIITTASKNYTGLFCLDYGTLLCFAIDVVKYVKQSTDKQKNTLTELFAVSDNILTLECAWYDAFREDVLLLAQKDGFYDTFNPELIMTRHEEIIKKLETGHEHRVDMLLELQEWNVDED